MVKKNKQPKAGKSRKQQLLQTVRSGLDKAAADYVRLILDPCRAPLVPPVYGGSSGAYLAKFEAYVGPSGDSGYMWWSPGTSNSVTSTSGLVMASAADSATSIAWPGTGQTPQTPGYAFLSANSGSYRPVAACAEIMWNDTELNRCGTIAVGTVANSALWGQAVTVDQLMPLCQYTARTPDLKVDAAWLPSEAAGGFDDFNTQTASNNIQRHNGLLFTWAGIKGTSAGFKVRLTLVAEWKPEAGKGLATPPPALQSKSNMNSVFSWLADNSDKLIRVGGQMAAAYARYSQVSSYRPGRGTTRIEL